MCVSVKENLADRFLLAPIWEILTLANFSSTMILIRWGTFYFSDEEDLSAARVKKTSDRDEI